jgi:hypothetical protein
MAQILVSESATELINLVAERWGYYYAKRLKMAEMMKATATERAQITAVGKRIAEKMGLYLKEGKDVRSEIASLQAELSSARAVLKEKAAPFYQQIAPLNKALSYLDKEVIPVAIEKATGERVVPRFQISDYVLKAIMKPSK